MDFNSWAAKLNEWIEERQKTKIIENHILLDQDKKKKTNNIIKNKNRRKNIILKRIDIFFDESTFMYAGNNNSKPHEKRSSSSQNCELKECVLCRNKFGCHAHLLLSEINMSYFICDFCNALCWKK